MHARIGVLGGDGIGPEVTGQAVRVLRTVGERYGQSFEFEPALLGGCAIDATGGALPEATLRLAAAADAVLLGAVGGPRWDNPQAAVRPEQGLLGLRKALGLFANLRPVAVASALIGASTLKPETLAGVDLLVVRELTGGAYFGPRQEAQLDAAGVETAFDTMIYTRPEIERVVRVAARAAQSRRGKLTSVDKANVLASSRLWRRVATEVVAREFPGLIFDHLLVDAAAMHLIRRPATFDVIVTENLFGDILTDEASMLSGSMGMLPSASVGADLNPFGLPRGLYEPIHGSAPDIAGQGVANPLGAILSAAMLVRHSLGLEDAALAIEQAVAAVLTAGYRTGDIAGAVKPDFCLGTEAMGNQVMDALRRKDSV